MGKPKMVAPPDPVQTANAQSAANIATAQEQQRLNMIGTSGPTGTTGYQVDASQPGGYTQYTNLSAPEQQTYDLSKSAENAALGVANSQIGRVNSALSNQLDLNSLPALQTLNGGSRPLQYSFDPGQQVQGQVGGDLNQALQTAQNAAYGQATSRLDPMYARQESQLQNRLANQGLSVNSEAYKSAQQQFGEGKNDAYNQAIYSSIGAGENAAQNLFARQLGQGQFANQAAGQMYQQNMGQAAFGNQAVGQQFGQDAQAAALNNQARNQALQEQAYVQNQPINQFNALMSAGQVSSPQGVQYQNTSVAPTDVLGAYAMNQQAQQANANARNQASSGLMSGLFGLGSAFLLSDVRLKRDIRKVGMFKGFTAYAYRYLWSPIEHVGVMAQDVIKTRPDAVVKMPSGFYAVNYGAL